MLPRLSHPGHQLYAPTCQCSGERGGGGGERERGGGERKGRGNHWEAEVSQLVWSCTQKRMLAQQWARLVTAEECVSMATEPIDRVVNLMSISWQDVRSPTSAQPTLSMD